MSDCVNVGIRELLPELLHDVLPVVERARVEAHLAGCADCTAELDVLRSALAAARARPVPRIDTRAIVAALPRAPRARRASATPTRGLWRIAAAMTVIALGGVSLTVVRSYFGEVPLGDSVAVVTPSLRTSEQTTAAAQPDTPTSIARPVNLTAGGGVSDLADEDLETLIGALDRIEAAPHVEPDTSAFTRIVSGATGGN